MSYQSEQSLENELVKQLVSLGYEKVELTSERNECLYRIYES